jgi:hypothetical protein
MESKGVVSVYLVEPRDLLKGLELRREISSKK